MHRCRARLPGLKLLAGLPRDRETEVLAAWHVRAATRSRKG
jgi:hypothetical protein